MVNRPVTELLLLQKLVKYANTLIKYGSMLDATEYQTTKTKTQVNFLFW